MPIGAGCDECAKDEASVHRPCSAALKLAWREEVIRVMDEIGMSRSTLSRRMGVSPASVTRMLGGEHNATLETMFRAAEALGRVPLIGISKQNV